MMAVVARNLSLSAALKTAILLMLLFHPNSARMLERLAPISPECTLTKMKQPCGRENFKDNIPAGDAQLPTNPGHGPGVGHGETPGENHGGHH